MYLLICITVIFIVFTVLIYYIFFMCYFFSVAYALLTSKTQLQYKRMFLALKGLRPDVKPRRMMLDFEKAVRNPAEEVLEVMDIKGCYFHFRQSTMKKRRKMKYNMKKEDTRLVAYLLDALAFLPVEQVTTGETHIYVAHNFPIMISTYDIEPQVKLAYILFCLCFSSFLHISQ